MCGISENCNELAQLQKLCYEYAQRFSGINIQMDSMAWVDFTNEHKNGCTYPKELLIGRGNKTHIRIKLVG